MNTPGFKEVYIRKIPAIRLVLESNTTAEKQTGKTERGKEGVAEGAADGEEETTISKGNPRGCP